MAERTLRAEAAEGPPAPAGAVCALLLGSTICGEQGGGCGIAVCSLLFLCHFIVFCRQHWSRWLFGVTTLNFRMVFVRLFFSPKFLVLQLKHTIKMNECAWEVDCRILCVH